VANWKAIDLDTPVSAAKLDGSSPSRIQEQIGVQGIRGEDSYLVASGRKSGRYLLHVELGTADGRIVALDNV
jgi:hypothetical protein